MEHVKFRVNQRGPPRKTKYFFITDSVLVPWGKGEIEFRKKSEIEHKTYIFQTVGGYSQFVI